MKTKIVLIALCSALTITACKKPEQPVVDTATPPANSEQTVAEQPKTNQTAEPPTSENTQPAPTPAVVASQFDINSLPEVDKDLGDFPYFKLPEWVDGNSSYAGDKNTDTGKLEVYTGDNFYPIEGKVFVKQYEMPDPKDAGRSEWDEYKFTKSFTKYFESLGAKKIWEGKVPSEAKEALNKLNNRDDYYYTFGHSRHENQVLYGLKYKGKPVFFSIGSNSAAGSIAVAEADEFVQTITSAASNPKPQ